MTRACRFIVGLVVMLSSSAAASGRELQVLFLGDSGHHRPAERFAQLQPVLAERGIKLTYTDRVADLNAATLAKYAGLVIYANIDELPPAEEAALLDYVAGGGGLVPLHCASFCFRNSPKYVELVGGQFKKHGTGTFRTKITEPDHELMRGFRGFESWDETYVHAKHNTANRIVLEVREDAEGREPWTWVRTQGRGRVFYTAWGHDERTWDHAGFQNLVERGIRWACGDDPALAGNYDDVGSYAPRMTERRTDVKPFEYVEAKVPFYPPGGPRKGDGAWNKMQLPLEPEESLKHYVHPDDFELRLFAAEPQIGKALAMTWDARGRLWLCESVDYPNELNPQGGCDKIRICEDTDGDGRADKFTVFAEGLSIPTTLAFHRGGVIVQNATETLYLKDTDGDDRADERRTLLTGWAAGDTHGGVSNFRYGPDNWYWAMQGYNNSSPVAPAYKEHKEKAFGTFRMGFFRFRLSNDDDPVVTDLEFIRSTNNNTWGLGFNEAGEVFGSTANGNPSEFMPIANRYYEAVRGWSAPALGGIAADDRFAPVTDNVRQVDHHGGFTAAAGHALYTARNYPEAYWNRTAFVCEPTGHLVATFVIEPRGAGYRSRNAWNLVASDDEWAAPIMAEVGPDGNVWVLDWYNYIVQHNPTPVGFTTGKGNAYETELRDKRHGRVFRVVPKGWKETKSPSLEKLTPQELVGEFRSANMLRRLEAQRLIIQRTNPPTAADLGNWLRKDIQSTKVESVAQNIHVKWTQFSVDGGDFSNFRDMKHLSQFFSEVVGERPASELRSSLETLHVQPPYVERAHADSVLLNHPDAHVRLTWLLGIADMYTPCRAGAAEALAILRDTKTQTDRILLDAAICAAARHDQDFLKLLVDEQAADSAPIAPVLFDATARVAEHFARGFAKVTPPPAMYSDAYNRRAQAIDTIREVLVKSATSKSPYVGAIVEGLARGWPKDAPIALDDTAEAAIVALLEALPRDSQGRLVGLAERLGSRRVAEYGREITAALLAEAADAKSPDERRIAAARQAVEFRKTDESVATALLKLLSPRTSPELARGVFSALAASEAEAVGRLVVEKLNVVTPAARPEAIRLLLAREAWTPALLNALERRAVEASELSLDQKQALAAHPNAQLRNRAKKLLAASGGLPNPDRQKVLDELRPVTETKGDAAAGKLVFTKTCAKCHQHGGEGQKIGPDLTGMAVHPKRELLVHLIDPNRSVEGNFRVYTVETDDGRVLTGLLAAESKTAIELVDAEGKRHPLQRDAIEALTASNKSLMPEGFEKQVSRYDLTNLLEFLTARGKFFPLDLRKAATAVSTRGMFYNEESQIERLVFDDWSPKTFAGVPFTLVDPQGSRVPNVVLLHSVNGKLPPQMPSSVRLPCNSPIKSLHLLSGVGGWAFNGGGGRGTTSLIVRLHYVDGKTEDHALVNGEHFADYIRHVEVPGSKMAFDLHGRQIRYLAITPKRPDVVAEVEFVKGTDRTAPIVMAATVEAP
ncbi:MAG: ThuA domain-containing protein [Planctomycetaceae bacterium]|nr:ThuA domain-containing protein [Planctomycetaceae bacterium]